MHELETAQIYKEIEQNASQFTSVSPYESFFDQLERRGTLVSTIANTGNTLPRVLFYMLLCDACKAPMLLHPNKDRFLKYISDRCVSEALKTIEDEADRILIGDANDLSKSGVSLPPLAEHIFDFAVDKGISISEAMNDVRESKDAKAFRGWLNEIQICTNDGSRKALLEGRKQLSEFRSVVERWAKNMDVGLDVNHKYAVFGIGISTDAIKERTGIEIKIPDISLKIRDPILNPRRHFKFIASWYKG